MFLIRFITIFLTATLIVISASAQEVSTVESASTRSKDDSSFASATAQHPLKPPDTSSPRATLESFIDNVNRSYSVLMAAHRKNLKTPGFFTSEAVEKMANNAARLFERAIWCLNLSQVPVVRMEDVSYEATLKLKEMLDRIELPPFDQIPDAEAVAKELEEKKYPRFLRWIVANTNIEIARVEDGPRKGEFLFTPQTIDRLDEYYGKVKNLPYKVNAFITHDFLKFYESTPGRLLPPKWSRLLPAWSNKLYHAQTIWQWFALIVLSLLTLLFIWWAFYLVLRSRVAVVSPAKRYWRRVIFSLVVACAIWILFYVLDKQVNLTGTVLSVVRYSLTTIWYFLLATAVFFAGVAVAETIVSSPKIDPEGVQASYLRALFGLIGFLAAAAIFIAGLYRVGVTLVPLLTGLGVGGLAFALAAKPTLGNIIGSFTIFVDKPFRVGQRVNVMGQDGTVESIGLRSTKIRLLTGPLTSIPNDKMANAEVVNIGRRPYIRRLINVTITYDTPPEKINRAVELLREILSVPEVPAPEITDGTEELAATAAAEGEADPQPHPNEAINQPDFPPRVYFNDLNADSLNILVIYWYHPPDYWNYLEHAHWINIQIMERFNAEGIDFAFPTQTLHMAGDEKRPLDVGQRVVSKEETS
jgi:MscS family membrane protein